MCMEMTKTYDDGIGLRQLLYICKAEKTPLNNKVVNGGSGGGGMCLTNCCRQKIRASNLVCLKGN